MDHHSMEGIPRKMGGAAHTAMSTAGEFRHQKERLELLLKLTTKITSSLDLREVLRAIAANIRYRLMLWSYRCRTQRRENLE
jgi:hypothetical protein